MPIYEYKCGKCQRQWEEFRRVEDREYMSCCGRPAQRVFSPVSRPVILDYYNESIDKHITGPQQRDKIYKELDVHEVD